MRFGVGKTKICFVQIIIFFVVSFFFFGIKSCCSAIFMWI